MVTAPEFTWPVLVTITQALQMALAPVTYKSANVKPSVDPQKQHGGCKNGAGDPIEVDSGTKILSMPLFTLPGEPLQA